MSRPPTVAVVANNQEHLTRRVVVLEGHVAMLLKLTWMGMGCAAGFGALVPIFLPKIVKAMGWA